MSGKVKLVLLFLVGVGFLFPFDYAITITLGIAFLFAYIVYGVFLIASPEFLESDNDPPHENGRNAP